MPFSSSLGKKEITQWILDNSTEIKKVIDVGVGCGTYANLLSSASVRDNIQLTGIEAWHPYIEKYKLSDLYDTVINQDARTIEWNKLGIFDLAFAGDVLEHMTKDEAISLVNKLLNISSTLIISIPITYMPQDEYEGNPFEIHIKPDWTHEEVTDTWSKYIKKSFIGLKKGRPRIGIYWMSNEKF